MLFRSRSCNNFSLDAARAGLAWLTGQQRSHRGGWTGWCLGRYMHITEDILIHFSDKCIYPDLHVQRSQLTLYDTPEGGQRYSAPCRFLYSFSATFDLPPSGLRFAGKKILTGSFIRLSGGASVLRIEGIYVVLTATKEYMPYITYTTWAPSLEDPFLHEWKVPLYDCKESESIKPLHLWELQQQVPTVWSFIFFLTLHRVLSSCTPLIILPALAYSLALGEFVVMGGSLSHSCLRAKPACNERITVDIFSTEYLFWYT